jgi:hypothetical protein
MEFPETFGFKKVHPFSYIQYPKVNTSIRSETGTGNLRLRAPSAALNSHHH